MIKLVFKIINTLFVSIWSIIYFIIGIFVIFTVSYLMGHNILDSQWLVGNDSTFALSLIYWFDKFFPRIPLWYPVQGTGVSLFHSYPMFSTFIVIILKHIAEVSAIESFRIVSFSTFPLTAIGIYLLCWSRLKSQTVGLIAGIFFLLSQASWLFQVLHGIFAQSFSLIFVAPTFLFFDLFMEKFFDKGKKSRLLERLYFALAVVFVGLTHLAHPVTGTVIVISLFAWCVLRYILSSPFKFSFKILANKIIKSVIIVGIIALLGEGLAGFWLTPFSDYINIANRGGSSTRDLGQLQEESLKIPSLLGIGQLREEPYRYDFFFFAAPVLIFFAIGTAASIFLKNKKIQIFSILAVSFVFLTTVPIYLPFIAVLFKLFFTAVYFRALIPAFILLPVVAAWGAWIIPNILLIMSFKYLSKKTGIEKKNILLRFTALSINSFLIVLASLFTFLIVIWSIKNLAHKPPPNTDPKVITKHDFQAYGPSLSDDFEKSLNDPAKYFAKLPAISISKTGLRETEAWESALGRALELDKDKNMIVDVSPFAVSGMIMQGAGTFNEMRFINLYHYFASLTHSMWGYQQGVFYGSEPLYKSPALLSDLSDWFGIKYSIVVPGYDPIEKYKAALWAPSEKVAKFNGPIDEIISWNGIKILENPKPTGLYTVSTRPVILVINDFEKGGFEHVFRSANLGALSYKDAWLVEGKKNIDDYSLKEISNFDGVILHGYSYRSRGGAWDMLKQYVEHGGKVFVDTGWQYMDKDWGNGNSPEADSSLPDLFPVTQTHWDNVGTSWEAVSIDKESSKSLDLAEFAPPVWSGNPWGMALARKEDLRSDAKLIMWTDDKILMASREIGSGKIVWSGINVFSHMTGKAMNEEEAKFLNKILVPLFSKTDSQDIQDVTYKRDFPDNAVFIINKDINTPSWLLFKESFSPWWKTLLESGGKSTNLQIYRAGPGFMLIRIPGVKSGDIIKLEYSLGFKDGFLVRLISVAILVFIIFYIPFGYLIKINKKFNIPEILKNKFHGKVKNIVKMHDNEEENY